MNKSSQFIHQHHGWQKLLRPMFFYCHFQIVNGTTHEHHDLASLKSSAQDGGCPLCGFFMGCLTSQKRSQVEFSTDLVLHLEQHSSRARSQRTVKQTLEMAKQDDEDDYLRDGMIGVAAGYATTLIGLTVRQAGDRAAREVCYITLQLSTGSGKPVENMKVQYSVGRRVLSNPQDAACYSIATNWIKGCVEQHDCGEAVETAMPTRVLDISTVGNPYIRLYITVGKKGKYVALSHCWGLKPTSMTVKENKAERQDSIDIESLPANFRDVILIARSLGYGYVWIDSLCIIQGDRDDWVKESSRMGSVYRNCALMVAAVSAPDSHGGLLNPRPASCKIPGTPIFLCPKARPLQTLEESQLGSRAWAAQERVLAPRILDYDASRMYWECRDGRRAEATCEPLRELVSGLQ